MSGAHYYTFGHCNSDSRTPYFSNPELQSKVDDFQDERALIETEIRKRNRSRPLPYPLHLPSQIPNSVSI